MLADLARVLAVVRDGHEAVPTWHIFTPTGDFVIMTRFADKPDQRERVFTLVPRFMAWKLATAFVMTGRDLARSRALPLRGGGRSRNRHLARRAPRGDPAHPTHRRRWRRVPTAGMARRRPDRRGLFPPAAGRRER